MGIIEGTRKVAAGGALGAAKPAAFEYDFAVDGGGVGSINLRGDQIPAGAIVVDALLHIDTVPDASLNTLSLGIEGAADLQAAAARNAAPWSTVGAKRVTITATSAPVKTTVERPVTFAINTAALIQGKFRGVVWYLELS